MDKPIEICQLRNRLSSLQRLCSNDDKDYPQALLFIAGQDGRSNKGTMNVLKYLLRGSVGKELMDDTLDAEFEVIEDVIFMVQSDSLSVIWSHEMKDLLFPVLKHVPNLVEYLSTAEEENDIELLQMRKCVDFKRMMLASVSSGGGVGIPVPIAYDDIMEVENWPMLQSFAIDSVYCSTGFFTTYYDIADITSNLDILFRCVDGLYVDNAIRLLDKTILPHVHQSISQLDSFSADQRSRVTAENVAGPLEILFEFGEMEAPGEAIDSVMRPIVLFGRDTDNLGSNLSVKMSDWREKTAGDALHVVLEGCEPSTGLRWCRAYFLAQGKAINFKDFPDLTDDHLVESSEKSEEKSFYKHEQVPGEITISLQRMQNMYLQLWLGLKKATRLAFAINSDILIATSAIETAMNEHMKSVGCILLKGEQLRVHFDCADAFGQLLRSHDIEDLGGSCWVYIRVSVNGILNPKTKESLGTIAVGDSFLFSSYSTEIPTILNNSTSAVLKPKNTDARLQCLQEHLADCCCVTQVIPYFRSLLGSGAEETSANRLITLSKSPYECPLLGLGQPLEGDLSTSTHAVLLTDHPATPTLQVDLRLFTDGFFVDRMERLSCLPFVCSFALHVERVWTIDCMDALKKASTLLPFPSASAMEASVAAADGETLLPFLEAPDGFLIIFRLNSEVSGGSFENSLPFPVDSLSRGDQGITPSGGRVRHVGILVRSTRGGRELRAACAEWRNSMRRHGLPEYRGGEDVAVPDSILLSFMIALDAEKTRAPLGSDGSFGLLGSGSNPLHAFPGEYGSAAFFTTASTCAAVLQPPGPGLAFFSLRCIHCVSDALSLSLGTVLPSNENEEPTARPTLRLRPEGESVIRDLLVLSGSAGIGLNVFAQQLSQQLQESLSSEVKISCLTLDLSDYQENEDFESFLSGKLRYNCSSQNEVMLLSVIYSPKFQLNFISLLAIISYKLNIRVSAVLSVVAPSSLFQQASIHQRGLLVDSGYGLGFEFLKSDSLATIFPTSCDIAVAIVEESLKSDKSYTEFRLFFDSVNSDGKLFRISPSNMRLNEDELDILLKFYVKCDKLDKRLFRLSNREANVLGNVGYFTVPSLLEKNLLKDIFSKNEVYSIQTRISPKIVDGNSIRILSLTPEKLGFKSWDTAHLMDLIKFIFPTSKMSQTAIIDTWQVPGENKKKRVNRFAQLAAAKVMSQKRREKGNEIFLSKFMKFKEENEEGLKRLIIGIKSIHGISTLQPGLVTKIDETSTKYKNFQASSAIIEACESFVIVRAINEKVDTKEKIIIQGVFDENGEKTLTDLFKLSERYTLKPRVALKLSDFSKIQKIQIQNSGKFRTKPLPNRGVWFDGQSYLDISGNQSLLRPDIDEILEEYIVEENVRIEQLNDFLYG